MITALFLNKALLIKALSVCNYENVLIPSKMKFDTLQIFNLFSRDLAHTP